MICPKTLLPNEFRKSLNLYDVPFLLGGLGDFLKNCEYDINLGNYVKINEALKKVACSNEMTGFVCAEGLDSNPDNLHFSAKSLREFGVRYYNEFIKIEDKNKVFVEKTTPDQAIRSEMEAL